METYFLILKAVPAQSSEHHRKIAGIHAHFWIKEKSPGKALERANHYLYQYQWEPVSLEQEPVETTAEQFAQRDIGLEKYQKAQRYGLSAAFYGWPEDQKDADVVLSL